MRKLIDLVVLLLTGAPLFAAPVGNPAFPQLIQEGLFIPCDYWVDLRLGYEGDFIGDGRMNQSTGGTGRVDDWAQDTNSGTVTFNFIDRLDLFGIFGSSRICADWRFSTPAGAIHRIQLETKYRFLWAIGARGILYEWGGTILGIGGRYTRMTPQVCWATIDGAPISTQGAQMTWREWQIDLDLAHKIDLFIPYVGVKYSNAAAKISNFSTAISNSGSGTLHMNNRTPVGIVIGCTLTTEKYFMLNVEGRLIDEEALTISGDMRF